jgi:hypothetical protein
MAFLLYTAPDRLATAKKEGGESPRPLVSPFAIEVRSYTKGPY